MKNENWSALMESYENTRKEKIVNNEDVSFADSKRKYPENYIVEQKKCQQDLNDSTLSFL